MQLKLVDPATRQVYPMRDDVYLRGSVVTWYSQNHWRRDSAAEQRRNPVASRGRRNSQTERVGAGKKAGNAAFRIGPPVVQQITMEPYLDRDDLFYIWPLVEPVGDSDLLLRLGGNGADAQLERRAPRRQFQVRSHDQRAGRRASGHAGSGQPRGPRIALLQMPSDRPPLPRLTALAGRWLRESGLPLDEHYEVARWFERQLSSSGQFQYSLQGPERDTSIDAIEDFVSNNPRGHCEYFATALALMLRSQGIPSRVVLGYRCDEWHEDQQCYQVRQLHAARLGRGLPRPRSDPGGPAAERSRFAGRMAAGCDWIRRRRPKWAPRRREAPCGAPGRAAGTAWNATGTSTSWTWIATSNASRSMSRFPGRRGTSPANCSIPAGGENLRRACGPPWPPCCEAV